RGDREEHPARARRHPAGGGGRDRVPRVRGSRLHDRRRDRRERRHFHGLIKNRGQTTIFSRHLPLHFAAQENGGLSPVFTLGEEASMLKLIRLPSLPVLAALACGASAQTIGFATLQPGTLLNAQASVIAKGVQQTSVITHLNALLAAGGVTMNDVQKVPTVNVIRASEDFKSGKIDLFFFAVGAPKVQEIAAAVGGLRVLPMEVLPDSETRMK